MGTVRERRVERSVATALALSACGVAFERAGPSVLGAPPEELARWVRAHRAALCAQSGFFIASTVPLLTFFAALQERLDAGRSPRPPCRLRGRAVLDAGTLWLACNAGAQLVQVRMALSAHDPAPVVAHRSDLMRRTLAVGNLPLVAALATTAVEGRRTAALAPSVTALSAATALLHLVPLAGFAGRRGRSVADGPGAYLPYPAFVAWLVAVAATAHRRRRSGLPGADRDPAHDR